MSIQLSQMKQIWQDLPGEFDDSLAAKICASTDNSVFWQTPEAILYPKSPQDIEQLSSCLQEGLDFPMTPRGGFTGTNGQSLNSGLIVDFSRFWGDIHESEALCVQAGATLDQINQYLKPQGRFFAPHVSTSSRATLGGMFGTNAAGKGSLRYGRTQDHILEVKWLFPHGEVKWLSQSTLAELRCLAEETQAHPFWSQLYQYLSSDWSRNYSDIIELWPEHTRGLSGYNLQDAWDPETQVWDWIAFLCGAEGSLGLGLEFKIKTSPLPQQLHLYLLAFSDLDQAQVHLQGLLDHRPIAVELVDAQILQSSRALWPKAPTVFTQQLEEAQALFLMETDQAIELPTHLCHLHLEDPALQERWWRIRSQGVELLSRQRSASRPVAFAEDTVVPPEHLSQYMQDLKSLLNSYGLQYSLFGHADVGCVHMRPFLNLQDPEQAQVKRSLEAEIFTLVRRYDGTFWGEHGRGYRTQFNQETFSESALLALESFKQIFDPAGLWNPNKILHTGFEPELEQARLAELPAELQDQWWGVIQCNGNAACLNHTAAAPMCPSYAISRNRTESPKGRALLAREWLRDPQPELERDLAQSLESCLSCHACSTQCPVEVDIPRFKNEFNQKVHHSLLRRLQAWVWRQAEQVPLWIYQSSILRKTLGWIPTGWTQAHPVSSTWPEFLPLWDQIAKLPVGETADSLENSEIHVILDPYTYMQSPQKILRVQSLLEAWGVSFTWIGPLSLHKMAQKQGRLDLFENGLEQWRQHLPETRVYSIEPTVTHTLASLGVEDLCTYLLGEFQLQSTETSEIKPSAQLLTHCHAQAQRPQMQALWDQFVAKTPWEVQLPALSCCGQAGDWGYQHPQESRVIFEKTWKPWVQNQDASEAVYISGASCQSITRSQLGQASFNEYDLLGVMSTAPFEVIRLNKEPNSS